MFTIKGGVFTDILGCNGITPNIHDPHSLSFGVRTTNPTFRSSFHSLFGF
jgi:hypothetical protein